MERPAASARFGVADRSSRVVVGETDLGADGGDLPCEDVRRALVDGKQEVVALPQRVVPLASTVERVGQRPLKPPDLRGRADTLGNSRSLDPGGVCGIQVAKPLVCGRQVVVRAGERAKSTGSGRDLDAPREILESVPVAMLYTCGPEHCQRLAQGFLRAQLLSQARAPAARVRCCARSHPRRGLGTLRAS